KPKEFVLMIEETAGTRMFEIKKQNALKTIEKKQAKVEEITRVLEEEITPTLERLRSERKSYMEWLSNTNEIDRINRIVVAYEYTKYNNVLSSSNSDFVNLQTQEQELNLKIKQCQQSLN